ncbi:enoyl-CoA hydratase-related protein [Micrococcus luteus]|nr:enoyl-CoA hydratase-related protein [Micrococcus luteus]
MRTGADPAAGAAAGGTAGAEAGPVRVEVSERLAVVTINRPERRNTLDRTVVAALRRTLEELGERAGRGDVGAVAFSGAGEKAFVAGADIGELATRTAAEGLAAAMQRLYDEVESFPVPTLAAVNGYAFGGGAELAMACDVRIAAENARFGLPETALGIIPGAGGTQRLSRLVGTGRALEMILTGRAIDAAEALRIGLVTAVVPGAELLGTVRATAGQILAKGPLAVRLARLVVRGGAETDQRTGLLLERLAQSVLYTTEDKAEGTAAFTEKRDPVFRGL